MIADDYRDNYGLMLGLAEEKGVISMLRLPRSLAQVVFPGGLYDLKGTVLDRDTDFSPETILINAARRVDEERGLTAQAPAGSTIPSVIQDAWHRSPKDNIAILMRLVELPPNKMGSLTAAVFRSTARALVWLSNARTISFAEIGEEAVYNLAAIANSKGFAPERWLASRISMVKDVIDVKGVEIETPNAQVSAEVVAEVVRQQAQGVRPPGPTRGGGGGQGHAGHRSEGNARGTGGGQGGRAPDNAVRDNRIADGSMQDLIRSVSEEDWQQSTPVHGDSDPEFGEPVSLEDLDQNADGIPAAKQEELAAFDAFEAGGEPPPETAPNNQKKETRTRKKSSSPSMGNISFSNGRPRKKMNAPRVR